MKKNQRMQATVSHNKCYLFVCCDDFTFLKFILFLVLTNIIGQLHKWISMGPKSKVLHKEELGVSVTEQKIKQRVEEKAASSLTGKAQMHRTVEMLKRQCATVVSC